MLNPQAFPFFHPRRPNYYFQTPPPPPPPFPSGNLPLPSPPCCLHGPAPPPPLLLTPPPYYPSPYYTTYVCIHPYKPLPPPVENQRRQVWLPRCRTSAATHPRRATSLEFNEKSKHDFRERRTTVMIRNIPNKWRRGVLLDLLDKHCAEQNKTRTVDGDSPASEYDFVYLPMDFRNRCNLGYAFVNFTSPAAAQRLYQSLQGYKWRNSTKVAHVCYARIQGKAALVEHFSKSSFHCISEEFLPVVLSPPRDGSASLSAPTVLGTRVGFGNSTNLKA